MLRRFALVLLSFCVFIVDETASYSSSGGPHIADVNILLPPKMTYPVEYRLQGSDGCFKWSWDHHDILSVLPEYNHSSPCSTSARLRSIAPYSGRKETAVYATDIQTGNVVRCKVFIDKISRIQIFHNSIKLDLDGLATLRVRAFDDEDNVFSSLVGLQFWWQLMPESAASSHSLAHIPLKDSPLSDCGGFCGALDIQIKLEEDGVYSDICVVKGTEIGHEIVSVNLLEPQLKHMADKIVLTVAEAMSLEPPSPVLVLIGATVHYSLKVIRGNIPQVVSLPSPHHKWYVSNSSVAQVDSSMGLTHALNLGGTLVVVEDTRVAGHKQVSLLKVVLPDTISLYISPLSTSGDPLEQMQAILYMPRWYIVSGGQYLVQMRVFSGADAQEVYMTKGDDVKWYNDETEFWRTFPMTDHVVEHGLQNFRILKAISQGTGKITASLTYFSDQQTKEVLKVVQEVIVCNQVKINLGITSNLSQGLLLPWAPGVYQEVELKTTGGCAKSPSEYKWFSSDMTIVSVSTSGFVQAKRPGKVTVRAVSSYDAFNYDEVLIEVSIPSSMDILPRFPVETIVGSHLEAAVTMKAPNGAYFYKCDAFSSLVKWKTGSESFVIVHPKEETLHLNMHGNENVEESAYGPPCSMTYIYASSSGQTVLHATLSKEYHQLDPSFYGPIILKASSRIAAYSPLVVSQASDGSQYGGYWLNLVQTDNSNQSENLNHLYTAPETQLDLLLLGGPEQWDKDVEFIETVDILDESRVRFKNKVLVQKLSNFQQGLYRVSCYNAGTFELVFKRGNLAGNDHPLPEIAEVSLLLICDFPSSITLIADQPVNERNLIRSATLADRSPGRVRLTPITVANGRTIRVAAVGISAAGEALANSSSLSLKWELNNCEGLAYWDNSYISERSSFSWEKFLVLKNESGMCIVRATVAGSTAKTGIRHAAETLENSESTLTDAIRLQLVSSLRVDPEFSLLYFSPNAKVNLSIFGGSCFLEASANDSRVVDVIRPPSGIECSQLRLSPKGLGSAVVKVHDIGLSPPLEAMTTVLVADIDWVKIVNSGEISLMEGSSQVIEVIAGIEDGRSFDSSQYAYMNIQVHIQDNIVELVENDGNSISVEEYVHASKFKIMAKHLGITTLYVSARQQSGHELLSQPVNVEVYPPPKIHPHSLFLLPGASYVLSLVGGPTIGAHIEYATMDDAIAVLQKTSGQLSAVSPGNTTLVATVYGSGGTVICQAQGAIKVGVPSSVTLNVQSELIYVGGHMPIHPLFLEGDVLSFYELCKNYNWTIEDDKVLNFRTEGQFNGKESNAHLTADMEMRFSRHSDERDLEFIKVLHGRSPGTTKVGVSFECDIKFPASSIQSRAYSSSISLMVVADPPLALGIPATWVLPPYYTMSRPLPSSLDPYGEKDGHGRRGNIVYSILRDCGGKIDNMQKDAITIDRDMLKTADSNAVACIQAKDRSLGRVDVATCVRVAEVTQIRTTTKEFPFHAINLAVGAEIEFPLDYCDFLGYPFLEAYNVVPVYAVTNYPNIVSINFTWNGNGNIHLKGIRHGRALVRVSIQNSPQKSDYMLVSVGARLQPQNPVLYMGSHVNFSVEGLNDKSSGQWSSANGSVLFIDKESGMAQAVGEGSTQVVFELSSVKLQTAVLVQTGYAVDVDFPKEMLTNVPFPDRGYNFPVKFSDTYGNKIKGLGKSQSKEVVFDCRVDPPFIGYAKPWVDLDSGASYCLFFPYTPEHLAHSIRKLNDTRSHISVNVIASLREGNHVMGSASAVFMGGFSILEKGELNLTPSSNKTVITIVGNTDVEIYWQGRDLMTISPVIKEGSGIGGRSIYEVKVLTRKCFKDKIIVSLPANSQIAEIDVIFEPGERNAPAFYGLTFWATLLGSLGVVIITAAIFMHILDRPDRPQSVAHAPAATPPPASNKCDSGSPAVLSNYSPRTPEPFVDYVRRTIDETPYYRREGRSRCNPQHTF